MMKLPKYGHVFLFLFFFLLSGCGGDSKSADTSARLTLKTLPFPEIQALLSKVTVSLEIAGKTCLLNIDADWTLSGQCAGIPTGSHAFIIKYIHADLGVTLGSAAGNLTLTSGNQASLTVQPLTKNQDDDGDQHSNLLEVMFGTDPKNAVSKPGVAPFDLPKTFSTGKDPGAIAVGLLNADALIDVVTANSGDDTVTVLLGNLDGTFQLPVSYPTGASGTDPLNPVSLLIKDMNGDSRTDIVVANSGATGNGTGDVSVLIQKQDGTFQAPVSYPVGDEPVEVVVGDLNKDGFPDIVTANFKSKDISVLLGKVDGTFQASVSYSAGAAGDVTALALGDLNGDGHLDVVASLLTAQSIAVFLGTGDGTLRSPTTRQVGIIISVSLKDLNFDNNLDLVLALASKTVAVLFGNVDGTFQTPAFYSAGRTPGSLAIVDLDLDGAFDVITENEGEGVIAVLMGNLDGTFRPPVFYPAGKSPSMVAVAFFNNDGDPDIFVTDRESDNVVLLLSK